MAKQKPQTRIVVEIAGKLRRVLSIRQGSKGDLLITKHSTTQFLSVFADGSEAGIKESRFSVHVSDRSESNTVHGITVHTDGSRVDRHLSTNALRDGNFQPITVASVIDPRALPVLELPARGEVIKLPPYDPRVCTMYYSVWVCSPELGDAYPVEGPFSLIVWKFKRFTLLIPFCFTAEPSRPECKFIEFATTSEEKRSAEHIGAGGRVGPADGTPPRSVAGMIIHEFNELIAQPWETVGFIGRPDVELGPKFPNFSALPIG